MSTLREDERTHKKRTARMPDELYHRLRIAAAERSNAEEGPDPVSISELIRRGVRRELAACEADSYEPPPDLD